MRTKLGEPEDSLREFNAPLEQAASPSLEALQAVEQAYNTNKPTDQIPLLRHAVEIDPNLAWGYWAMGTAFTNADLLELGNSPAAQSYTTAFNLRDRVDQLTRYRIEQSYYQIVTGELNKAEQVLLQWSQQYPRARIQTTLLGSLYDVHVAMGKWEACASEAEELRRDYPASAQSYHRLIYLQCPPGKTRPSEIGVGRSASARSRYVYFHLSRYYLGFSSKRQCRNAGTGCLGGKRENNLDLLWMQSDTEAFYGHSPKARKLADRAIGLALRAGDKERASSFGAQLALREVEIGKTELER